VFFIQFLVIVRQRLKFAVQKWVSSKKYFLFLEKGGAVCKKKTGKTTNVAKHVLSYLLLF